MAKGLTVSRHADLPVLFRIGIMRTLPYLLARFRQAETHAREIDRKQAQRVLSYTIKLDEVWPQVRDLLIAMAPKMEQAGHRDDWVVLLEAGIEKSQKLGDLEAEAELRFHLGVLYNELARYDEARSQFEGSAAYFQNINHSDKQARALNSLANVKRCQRRFDEAKQLVDTALELFGQEKAGQLHSYLVLGLIAMEQYNWLEAYNFFSKSLALSELTDNQRMIAWNLNNLCITSWGLKRYEDAITYYERAMSLFHIIQDPVHSATAKMNLGIVYVELGRYSEALKLYLVIESIFVQTQDKLRLAMLNNNKGMVYHQLQQCNEAENAYKLSIELWQQIGNIQSLVNVMDNLGLLYLAQGLYDNAIATFQDALNQLAQIKNDPNYDYFFDMVAAHLRDAIEQHAPE